MVKTSKGNTYGGSKKLANIGGNIGTKKGTSKTAVGMDKTKKKG